MAYKQFETVENVKVGLAKWINLSKELDLVVEYIEPGHGAKGQKDGFMMTAISLICISYTREGDYAVVPLYCSERSRSSGSSKSSAGTKTSSKVAQSLISKREQVDAIVQKLRDKHQDKFTPPQLNTWAHCIHMKTHSSYDEPPDKPFFRVGSSKH